MTTWSVQLLCPDDVLAFEESVGFAAVLADDDPGVLDELPLAPPGAVWLELLTAALLAGEGDEACPGEPHAVKMSHKGAVANQSDRCIPNLLNLQILYENFEGIANADFPYRSVFRRRWQAGALNRYTGQRRGCEL